MGELKKRLKDQDMFGYPVQLTFNGSDSYKTTIGGIFSLLINFFLFFFFVVKLGVMITASNDSVSIKEANIDFEKYGNISMRDH